MRPRIKPWQETAATGRLSRPTVASVIMPVYNHAPYLATAIESVVAQRTEFPFELIIGEDASQDRSLEIALEFQRRYPERIRLLHGSANLGMHKNVRRCLEACGGRFIAFCEGDDYWTDCGKLQAQVDFLLAHPDHGAVHSDFSHVVRRRGRWKALRHWNRSIGRSIPEGRVFFELLRGNFIQTCTLCIDAAMVEGYYASVLSNERFPVCDWPLCLYIAGSSRIGYLREDLAVYRRVPGSAMNSGRFERYRTARAYLAMIAEFCVMAQLDGRERIFAAAPLQRALLSMATLAADSKGVTESLAWLREHDPDYLRPLRRRILHWVAAIPLMPQTLSTVGWLRAAAKDFRRYRGPAPNPCRIPAYRG